MKHLSVLMVFLCANFIAIAQSIDPDFAGNGRFQPDDAALMTTRNIEVAPDGKIYALFSIDFFASEDLAAKNSLSGILYCLLPNGDVFTDFGVNGKIALNTPSYEMTMVRDLHIASNGDLLICGLAKNESPFQESPVMFRYTSNGSPVANFGTNGTRVYSLFQGGFMSIAERNTGQLVVASDTFHTDGLESREDVRLVRMSSTGDIDPSFGTNGEYLLNTTNQEFVKGVLINEYDNVIFYGHFYNCPLSGDCSLSNFMIYGDADMNQFEEAGVSSFQNAWSPIYDMHDGLISPENEFIGLSNQYNNDLSAFPIFHTYNFDEFFGINQGFLAVDGLIRTLTVIEREAAGTYLVAGFTAAEVGPTSLLVSRRNPDGTVNTEFNNGLHFSFSINTEVQRVRTSAMQSSGSMLLGMEGFDLPTDQTWFNFVDEEITEKIAVVMKFIPGVEVSIDDHTMREINLYPNPVNDVVNIQLPTSAICNLQIFDMTGKLVMANSSAGGLFQLNVSGLAKGMYQVQVNSAEATHQMRFIKE